MLHRGDKEPTPKRALIESRVWVTFGLAFALVIAIAWGGQASGEYLAGYLIEKSLSVDNVFVWAVIFCTFAIPLKYQHRVLFWGIFGALILRAIFIGAGVALIAEFWWLLVVFGVFLICTGFKVLRHRDDEGTHGHDRAVQAARALDAGEQRTRRAPLLHEGERQAGRDAAVRGAGRRRVHRRDLRGRLGARGARGQPASRSSCSRRTRSPSSVCGPRTSCSRAGATGCTISATRSALILIFVGAKMAVSHWWHMPTALSLGVIVVLLVIAVIASLVREKRAERSLVDVRSARAP